MTAKEKEQLSPALLEKAYKATPPSLTMEDLRRFANKEKRWAITVSHTHPSQMNPLSNNSSGYNQKFREPIKFAGHSESDYEYTKERKSPDVILTFTNNFNQIDKVKILTKKAKHKEDFAYNKDYSEFKGEFSKVLLKFMIKKYKR
jgi:hypothetical protein